ITKTVKARGAKMEAVIEERTAPAVVIPGITYGNLVPKVPFLGYRLLKNIRMEQVFPYINKISLFRAQWQFRRGNMSPEEYEKIIQEKVEPLYEEMKKRAIREKILQPAAIYGFYPCYSRGDELVVLDESGKNEKVRFTFPRQKKEPYYCLSDFFRPKSAGLDVAGFQVVTVGSHASEVEQKLFTSNQYTDYLYLHGLSVESAEGLAEYVHALIRKEMGIASTDSTNMEDMFRQGYQGSRYSFGYPACPHLEDQTKLFELVPADKIGISLTEEFQLVPEQSTSAIVVHHPRAKYFNI
ncbi:MAG: hypothetical protein HYZ85_04790, partial [Candidatus Omnitrophica bacterium]|nr:hypothetical protein [Candidatus Omnitrophota bacterium]